MKLSSGKRIGQSGQELAAAAFFSFCVHVLVVLAAAFLYLGVVPRKYIPPYYVVKLVGQPSEPAEIPSTGPAAVPKQEHRAAPKEEPKEEKVVQKERKAPAPKTAMPELQRPVKKPAPVEQIKPPESPREQPPTSPNGATRSGGAKGENVAVTTPQQDFRFAWYIAAVREKIGQKWRPPPEGSGAKARVLFTINRSGWVGDVNLDTQNSSGSFGFQQAAVRAIRSSNPFPPLPEEFTKQTLEFSVDLMAE